MAPDLVVLDGSTFFVSDPAGDVEGEGPGGFFFRDVRHLSGWSLTINGSAMRVLSSRVVDYYSARVFGTAPIARVGANPPISIQRDRIVAGGVHEDLWVRNHSEVEQPLTLEITIGSDFADIFELKDPAERSPATPTAEPGERELTLWHERRGARRGTHIEWSADGLVVDGRLRFEAVLPPRAEWQTCIDVSSLIEDERHGPRTGHGGFGKLQPQLPRSLEAWLSDAPKVDTDSDGVAHTYRRSLVDLAALRFRPLPDLSWSLPAAGLPWFMALFGRDSLITAYMALPFQPHLAATTLDALSELQATERDDFRDADRARSSTRSAAAGWRHSARRRMPPTTAATIRRRCSSSSSTSTSAGQATASSSDGWRGLRVRRSTGSRAPAIPMATGIWNTRRARPRVSATRAGRTRGTRFCSPTDGWQTRRLRPARSRDMPMTHAAARPD